MIRFLREFWYALQTRKRRFELAYSLVAGMPGNYGVIARGALAPGHERDQLNLAIKWFCT